MLYHFCWLSSTKEDGKNPIFPRSSPFHQPSSTSFSRTNIFCGKRILIINEWIHLILIFHYISRKKERYYLAFLEWYLVTVLSLVVVENFVFLSLHKAVRKEPDNSPHLPPPPVVVAHLLAEHPDVLQQQQHWLNIIFKKSDLPLFQAYFIVFLSIVAKQNSVFLLTWGKARYFVEDCWQWGTWRHGLCWMNDNNFLLISHNSKSRDVVVTFTEGLVQVSWNWYSDGRQWLGYGTNLNSLCLSTISSCQLYFISR